MIVRPERQNLRWRAREPRRELATAAVRVVCLVVALLVSTRSSAAAPETRTEDEPVQRPPLPEPIFTETTTDIDGYEPGEIEFDVNGSQALARRNAGRIRQVSVELEGKVWSRLGIRLEPSFSSSREAGALSSGGAFGFRGAAGWGLLHDFKRDFHLQIEASERFIDDTPYAFRIQPGKQRCRSVSISRRQFG